MKTKIILLSMTLLFVGCSKKTYQHMYERQSNPFSNQYQTKGEADFNTMQNGENPMDRPSYKEYQEVLEDKKFEAK